MTLAPVSGMIVSGTQMPVCASKQTEEALQKAKDEASAIQDASEENQENIDNLENVKGSLQNELSNLNTELSEISDNLEDLATQISDKEAEIAVTQKELEEAQARLDEQYASMKKRIQFLYEKGQVVYLELFMKAGSLADFMNRTQYIEQLSAYDRKMFVQFTEERQAVEDKKAELENENAQLQDLQDQTEAEHGRVSGLVSSTSGSIAAYADQIEDAEAVADELQAQLDAKNSEITALQAQLAEERRLEALSKASVWRSIGDLVFTEDDRYLLANLIYCEAGNQPYEGQIAVGAVVINRMMSGAFPNTLSGVVYQKNQFEPVSTGRLALALARNDATEACYNAADAAMSGQSPVGDCIFFRTPIPEVEPKYVIGGHIFY